MEVCYYCESKKATKTRYGKPACDECFDEEIRSSVSPKNNLSEEEKAKRLKMILLTFKEAFSEKE